MDPIGFVLVFCLTTSLVLVLGLTTGLVDPTTNMLDPVGILMDTSLPMGFTFSFFCLMAFSTGQTDVACFFSNVESLEWFRLGSEDFTGMVGIVGFGVGPAGVWLDPGGVLCLLLEFFH